MCIALYRIVMMVVASIVLRFLIFLSCYMFESSRIVLESSRVEFRSSQIKSNQIKSSLLYSPPPEKKKGKEKRKIFPAFSFSFFSPFRYLSK